MSMALADLKMSVPLHMRARTRAHAHTNISSKTSATMSFLGYNFDQLTSECKRGMKNICIQI